MDNSQIIRLPKKYWELFNTMTNEEAGKLIKCLFDLDDCNLIWLTKTYFNIIKVDICNMSQCAINGQKWWRPKTKKTPGYENKKPQDIESNNQYEDNIKESNINKDNIKEIIIKEIPEKNILITMFFEKLLNSDIILNETLDINFILKINSKLKEIFELRKDFTGETFKMELIRFIDHHSWRKNTFANTLNRLNTWFFKNNQNKKWKK